MRLLRLGGPDRIRTDDPYNANVVRSQLRYRPIFLLLPRYDKVLYQNF